MGEFLKYFVGFSHLKLGLKIIFKQLLHICLAKKYSRSINIIYLCDVLVQHLYGMVIPSGAY
jgi:hypothetical protein